MARSLTRAVLIGGDEKIHCSAKAGILALVGAVAGLGLACSPSARSTVENSQQSLRATQQVATGHLGMVVSNNPLASAAGAEILKKGGNAVDAAIAVQFALNVAEPQYSGIGGGGFMMVYEAKTKQVTVIDCHERAARTAERSMFLLDPAKPPSDTNPPIPISERQTLGTAVAVPGTLQCVAVAHKRWGSLPLPQLIQPAIALADGGVVVNAILATNLTVHKSKLLLNPAAQHVFIPDGVHTLAQGERLVQRDLAKTFRILQREGIAPFYDGRIADAIVAAAARCVTLKENGRVICGSLARDDLRHYEPTLDRPVRASWHGLGIVTTAPPSAGGVTILQILQLLEKLNVAASDLRSASKYHLVAAAMHLAFADRARWIGDPEFVGVPVAGLLNADYVASRAALVNLASVDTPPFAAGNPLAFDAKTWPPGTAVSATAVAMGEAGRDSGGETSHFTVADRDHNLVAWTSTLEQAFGSGIMVDGYGFMLNNQSTDFNATPSALPPLPPGPNDAAGNKRPLANMAPTIVFQDGEPILTLGAAGGPRLVAAVSQVLINVFHYHLGLKAAIEEPRIFSPMAKIIQHDVRLTSSDCLSGLSLLDHTLVVAPVGSPTVAHGFLGVVNGISIDPVTQVYTGAADSGRRGAAIGIDSTE